MQGQRSDASNLRKRLFGKDALGRHGSIVAMLLPAALVTLLLTVVAVAFFRVRAERNLTIEARHDAEREHNRAEDALAQLRAKAPVYAALAEARIRELELKDALAHSTQAVEKAPTNASFWALHANVLQSLYRFDEAIQAYEQALRLDPDYPHARENIELSRRIINLYGMEPGAASLYRQTLRPVYRVQGRFGEAAALSVEEQKDFEFVLEEWTPRFQQTGLEARIDVLRDGSLRLRHTRRMRSLDPLAQLRDMPLRVVELDNASIDDISALEGFRLTALILSRTEVSDLKPLTGMPLELLNVLNTRVTDISPLAGMPLTRLNLSGTRVSDLSPLTGMAITNLNIEGTSVTDISPLRGMPLEHLNADSVDGLDLSVLVGMPLQRLMIFNTGVTDLSPLRGMSLTSLCAVRNPFSDLTPLAGMPLTSLIIGETGVRDLTPLEGMPLTVLDIRATEVRDLTPLKGMPLVNLDIRRTEVRDVTPLKGLPLRQLRLSTGKIEQGWEVLRAMSTLQRIGVGRRMLSAEEFWAEMDEPNP